jgi:hypothetical protein
MAPRFAGNIKIGAGALPLWPVRRDPTPPGSKLREQMCQFVAQGAIDFRLTVLAQTTIENDAHGNEFSAAGGGAETT